MPDLLVIFITIGLLVFAFVSALEGGLREAALLAVLGIASILWLFVSYNAPRSAVDSTLYPVTEVHGPEGQVSQVILTPDGVVNINEAMKGSVPPGKRVHRIKYSGWRRGIWWTIEDIEYTIADPEE